MNKNPVSFLCRLGVTEFNNPHTRCDGKSYGPNITDIAIICECGCHGKDGDAND